MTATWTKSDYTFFAEVLHNTPMTQYEREHFSKKFGQSFAMDNQNFDHERWEAAVFEGKLSGRGGHAQYGGWTKKTYELTAEIINISQEYGVAEDVRIALISAFGAAFERDNPRFDWDKFRKAAGSPYADFDEEEVFDSGDSTHAMRRVRVHQHLRSKPGGRVRSVRVRAHNREV